MIWKYIGKIMNDFMLITQCLFYFAFRSYSRILFANSNVLSWLSLLFMSFSSFNAVLLVFILIECLGLLIWGKNCKFFLYIFSPSNIKDCIILLLLYENLLLILTYSCCFSYSLSYFLNLISLLIFGLSILRAIFLFYY